MPEQDPLVRWVIVVAVVHRLRRHRARIIKREHPRRDERRVVAIADRDRTKSADDYWQCVHLVSFGSTGVTRKVERRRRLPVSAQGFPTLGNITVRQIQLRRSWRTPREFI